MKCTDKTCTGLKTKSLLGDERLVCSVELLYRLTCIVLQILWQVQHVFAKSTSEIRFNYKFPIVALSQEFAIISILDGTSGEVNVEVV